MSKHKTLIDGKTEFVFRCDKCGYTTDSVIVPGYQFHPPVCPVCKKAISQEPGDELPENTEGKGF